MLIHQRGQALRVLYLPLHVTQEFRRVTPVDEAMVIRESDVDELLGGHMGIGCECRPDLDGAK